MSKKKIALNKKKAVVAGISAVTGWTLAKQAGRAFGEVWYAGGRIAALARSAILNRRKPKCETFSQAVARLRLSEVDVLARASEFQQWTAWWFVGFTIGFGFLILGPVLAPSSLGSHTMLAVGAMGLCGTRAVVWHFRACQVNQRELFRFSEWIVNDIWMRRMAALLGMLLVVSLAFFATAANAADAGEGFHFFTPAPGDAAVGFLREMFGPVIDRVSTTGQVSNTDSIIGRMMGPFNSAVLMLGMLFVGYMTITGTINSAHDGEILGKKMSEIWVPIRTVGGTALVLPSIGGYCLAQVIVMSLLVQSIGIANSVLSAGLDYVQDTKMVMSPNLPDSRPLAASILKSEVCRAAMNEQYAGANQPMRINLQESPATKINTGEVFTLNGAVDNALPVVGLYNQAKQYLNSSYTVVNFEWRAEANGSGGNFINPVVCGAVRWEESQESSESNGNLKIAKGPIMQAHAAAVRQMIADLRPIAERIAKGDIPPAGALEDAAGRYESSLASAAKASVGATSDQVMGNFIKYAKDGGWIYLPAYYNQLIQLNDVMTSAINTLPSASPVDVDTKVSPMELQNYQMAMSAADEYTKARGTGSRPDLAPMQAYMQQADDTWKVPRNWEDAKRILSRPAQGAMRQFTQELAGSNLSHVGQIKAVGDTIIGAGELFATTMFTMSGFANANAVKLTVGNFFDVGAALSSISGILSTMVLLIFFTGAVAAYWIPMIPFIAGITAIIKWAVMAFEMVISAPMVAAAHIHPDGHDIVGKAAPAYMHYLNVALRPSLIVFGFFGSILIAQPLTTVINMMFMTAVVGAEHNSLSGIVAFMAYTGIYVIIMTGVVHSVFTLVNWLPDNALRVIGGSGGAQGIGDQEQHEATNRYQGALVNIRHGAGGGGRRPSGNHDEGGNSGGGKKGSGKDDGPSNTDLLGA